MKRKPQDNFKKYVFFIVLYLALAIIEVLYLQSWFTGLYAFIGILIFNRKNIKIALLALIWPITAFSLAFPIFNKVDNCYQKTIDLIYIYKEQHQIYPPSALALNLNDFSCKSVSDDLITVFNVYKIKYRKHSSGSYSLSYGFFDDIDDQIASNTFTKFD